ncbi:hypothetical protein [Streptomyces sp. NPDC058412]|uniref:hypothetical protein n=1 Tax=Streptomyces sp. NPDC058412 TaxID=3346486 RepID=UPI0036642BF8
MLSLDLWEGKGSHLEEDVPLIAPSLAAAVLLGVAPQAQVQAAPDCQGICVLGVRAATHPVFDRFVIDLGDGTIPQWVTST